MRLNIFEVVRVKFTTASSPFTFSVKTFEIFRRCQMNYFSEYGRRLFENDYSVFPINGKHAFFHFNPHCLKLPSDELVTEWESDFGDCNIAFALGPANGFDMLDIDIFTPALLDFVLARLPHFKFWRVGEKGMGVLIPHRNEPSRAIFYRNKNIVAVRRADGGKSLYMAAFGVHPKTGKPYKWHGLDPIETPRAELLESLVEVVDYRLDELQKALLEFECELDPRDIEPERGKSIAGEVGGRNNALKAQVGKCFSKGLPQDLVVAEILASDQKRHQPLPLFDDPNEIHGRNRQERAEKFVRNIFRSIINDRKHNNIAMPVPYDPRVDPDILRLEKMLSEKDLPASVSKIIERDQNDMFANSELSIKAKLHQDLTEILPDWFWSRETKNKPSEKTRPKPTLANIRVLFKYMGVTIRYNMVSKTDEIVVPEVVATQDNHTNVAMAHLTSWLEHLGLNVKHLYTYVLALADENAYSPIANWIESKDWDGVDRLPDFFKTVTVVGEDDTDDGNKKRVFKERLLHIWLIQAIAAVFSPRGISAGGMLVFQGDQYLGKTKWFKQLLPPELAAYRADGVTLHTQDKDSVLGVIAHWLVELGELDATFRRSDIAQLKAFVGKDTDKIRRPFARGWSDYARRTVFFASVNDKKFLNDPTGSRRFYTLECTSIDHSHQIDMQQLWAQVRVEWRDGASHFLTPDEIKQLGEQNQKFEQVSPFYDLVDAHFDWGAPAEEWTHKMSATEVVLAVGLKITSSHREPTSMAAALQKFGLNPHRRRENGNYYLMPPRADKKPHLVSQRIKKLDED